MGLIYIIKPKVTISADFNSWFKTNSFVRYWIECFLVI